MGRRKRVGMRPGFVRGVFLALALLALAPLAGFADTGTISGLSVSPSPASVGVAVTITVSGSGACGNLKLDYGDGSSTTLSAVTFPRKVSYIYASAGTMKIAVTAGTACQGSATTTLGVGKGSAGGNAIFHYGPPTAISSQAILATMPNLSRLVALVNPLRLSPCNTPTIEDGTDHPVSPGDWVWEAGCGFGKDVGEIRLYGNFPGGYVRLTGLNWQDDRVGGNIPYLSGVTDQTVTMQIITSKGVIGDSAQLSFTATRDRKMLFVGDVVNQCSSNSQDDWCNDHYSYTVEGSHSSQCCFTGASGDDFDTGPNLINGWTYADQQYTVELMYAGGGFVDFNSDASPGSTSWHLKAHWDTQDPVQTVGYVGWMHITGPLGLPYK